MKKYCDIEKFNNYYLLKFNDNLNIENGKFVKKQLEEILDIKDSNIIVDFSNVYYMDSNGLGIIITLIQKARHFNNKLIFININSMIKNILKITKVINLMLILDTIEEAKRYSKTAI
ncbi:hypothetical protein XO10_08770 [Marinitoga sp. 1135]|uniref:Anti-sigma factor antagonist n=1 Tax=Marinitoga piezophila (strain DSM 14283 / JCM 11233 / KA3) TaxID=443254 RepID=H2J5U1_MARPK|nr:MULTISPECIES: STAS domain-containing protein [Marinitoga]AEX86160.1 anti-anti-sigma factor [Marinitoga piezophila KA3]APT76575.1 hypothetical protein LN42_09450 [Marinitoga sp. 1137]NUU96342.1 hypothetical protein [Marinitoga sp. 1135]NUU98260.1 hypothetical protein [Marinitoga sp. 1138]